MSRRNAPTLGNTRELGVRSLDVSCWNCHHQAVLSADRWPDDMAVPTFGPRMVCTSCGIVGADAEGAAAAGDADRGAVAKLSNEERRAGCSCRGDESPGVAILSPLWKSRS
jgi:hypothetical protein